jgi:hypothetical protein
MSAFISDCWLTFKLSFRNGIDKLGMTIARCLGETASKFLTEITRLVLCCAS